jgi:hypothetical protein
MRLGEESIVILHPSWHTTVIEGRRTSAGPVGLGTTFKGIYDSRKRPLTTSAHPANFQHLRAVISEYFVPQVVMRSIIAA